MEDRLNTFVLDTYKWLYQTIPLYGIIAYNKGYQLLCMLFECNRKTVRGILDAHTPSSWIFLERNTYPMILKIDTCIFMNELMYDPELHKIILVGMNDTTRNTLDVVTAEVYHNNSLQFDMSSFFYNVGWTTSSQVSLFELVVIYTLENEKYIPVHILKKYSITILDSDGNTHTISLGSTIALDPIEKWQQSK